MQAGVKQAVDFAHGAEGFADCLREMNTAVRDGIAIDFSEWGQDAEPLIALEAESLESLMDLYRDFYSSKCKKGLQASKAAGVQLGRRKKALPENFTTAADLWLSGQLTGTEAARLCAMPVSSFYAKAGKTSSPREAIPAKAREICEKWAIGELSKQEAAEKLNISVSVFQKVLKENGIRKNYVPDAFEKYCALWEAGKLSKKEAARLCKISVHRFDGCLRKLGKYQREVV